LINNKGGILTTANTTRTLPVSEGNGGAAL